MLDTAQITTMRTQRIVQELVDLLQSSRIGVCRAHLFQLIATETNKQTNVE